MLQMNRFILNSLILNGNEIRFTDGMNFIVGANGSGKTTLFNLIMYVLGLKDIKRMINHIPIDEIVVKCTIGNRQVSITRYRDNTISFFGDVINEAKYGSRELYSIYNSLLNPVFDIEEDVSAGHEIIYSSFFSENNLYTGMLLQQTNKKLLGVNVEYMKDYKKQISIFRQRIENDEKVHDTLKTFISGIEREIESLSNRETFSSILKKQYLNMYDKLFENKRLLDDAIETYENVNKNQDDIYKERKEIIELQIEHYFSKFGISKRESSKNVSGGIRFLMNYIPAIARSVKYPNHNFINTSGLLLADAPFSILDSKSTKILREILLEECQNDRLQYIEFVSYTSDIPPNNSNIIHINSKEAFGWLGIN